MKEELATERNIILDKASDLNVTLEKNVVWNSIDQIEQDKFKLFAKQCAQIFQRSSSAVEGRNSHLKRFHHGLYEVPPRKLKAYTAVHNYLVERQDGTTAAERLFEAKPKCLVKYLLEGNRSDTPPTFFKFAK